MESQNIVSEADILQGWKSIQVPGRNGQPRSLTVKALNWRAAIGSTFKRVEDEIVFTVENAVAKDDHPLLDALTPNSLLEVRNVALQLTHGVDALKKAAAGTAATAASEIPPLATPSSSPSNAN